MRCPEVGVLRAYADGELEPAQRQPLDAHLAECDACRRTVDELEVASGETLRALSVLAPGPDEVTPPAYALGVFRERTGPQGGVWQRLQGGLFAMRNGVFGRGWKVATTSVAAVALAGALVLTPVGSAVGEWLSVFRAEQFAPITIDPSATRTAGANLNPEDFGTFETRLEPEFVEIASPAEAQLDFAVRAPTYLPEGLDVKRETFRSTPGEVIFKFDRQKSQAALAKMGVSGQLPSSVEGAVARVYVPAGVHQGFFAEEGKESGLVFLQGRSPTLELPSFLESKATRDVFYSLAGLPPEMASQLDAIAMTGNTAPVPVLEGDTSKKVSVDGTEGVFVNHRPAMAGSDAPEGSYIVWQKGGVVYVLGGTLGEVELLKVANSLK